MIAFYIYSSYNCDVAISRMASRLKKKSQSKLADRTSLHDSSQILTDITKSWQESTNKSLKYFWSVFNNNNNYNNYFSSSNKQERKTFL